MDRNLVWMLIILHHTIYIPASITLLLHIKAMYAVYLAMCVLLQIWWCLLRYWLACSLWLECLDKNGLPNAVHAFVHTLSCQSCCLVVHVIWDWYHLLLFLALSIARACIQPFVCRFTGTNFALLADRLAIILVIVICTRKRFLACGFHKTWVLIAEALFIIYWSHSF